MHRAFPHHHQEVPGQWCDGTEVPGDEQCQQARSVCPDVTELVEARIRANEYLASRRAGDTQSTIGIKIANFGPDWRYEFDRSL